MFQISMAVRDYECDIQGVVNNAIYQHYLEHARHEFLKTKGLDFAELTLAGIVVVVVRAELDYRKALRSGDAFHVSVKPRLLSPVRLQFEQDIVHTETGQLLLTAKIITTAVNARGRPWFPAQLRVLLD